MRWLIFILSLNFVLVHPVKAQDDVEYELFGQWRFVFSHAQDFPLNSLGEANGLNYYVDHLLRAGTKHPVTKNLGFVGEVELFYGQVEGDFDRVGANLREDPRETLQGWDLKKADLRQLWFLWNAPWFHLKIGQMGSHWGLGLLANDGRVQPGRFGFPDQGDLSHRLLLVTRPFSSLGDWLAKMILVGGGGLVYRDENARLRDGDLGGELLLSLFYREKDFDTGIYIAGRIQSDYEDTRLDVVALDVFGSWAPEENMDGPVLAAELAFVTGSTNRIIHLQDIRWHRFQLKTHQNS